ncbi:MAG: hypothetical protein AB7S38_39015 [Vulcanimicrobiota bacterium]
MKNKQLANVLAAGLLLVCIAAYAGHQANPLEPIQPGTPSTTPESETETAPVRGEPGPEAVVVRVLDNPLKATELDLQRLLFDTFAGRPEEEQFESYTTTNWQPNFEAFSIALVQKAQTQKLDSASLGKILELIKEDAADLAYLPVSAYQATLNDRAVWVVTVKWEGFPDSSLGHTRVYAFDQRTLKKAGFATCK